MKKQANQRWQGKTISMAQAILMMRKPSAMSEASFENATAQLNGCVKSLAILLQSSYTAVFYREKSEARQTPLIYHDSLPQPARHHMLLEKYWTERSHRGELKKNFLDRHDELAREEFGLDIFARENRLNCCYQHPCSFEDGSAVLVVAYWQSSPTVDISKLGDAVDNLARVMKASLSQNAASSENSEVKQRLQKLLGLFEVSFGEKHLKEIVSNIADFLRHASPDCSYALFSKNSESSVFNMNEFEPASPPRTRFIQSVSDQLGALTLSSVSVGKWLPLNEEALGAGAAALALPLVFENTSKIVLIVWFDERESLDETTKRLLGYYGTFAAMVLKHALMVNGLTKANRHLKKSYNEMANVETLAALTDMTSGFAHDFNNMIGGIVGRVQLMKLKCRDEQVLSGLSKIEHLALEGAETLKRIQEFTSSAKNKNHSQVDLVEVARYYFENGSHKWETDAITKNIRIDFNSQCEEVVIEGTAADLQIALEKVVENAVEHSSHNSAVTVELKNEGKSFVVIVSNRGIAIPEEIKNKIFYPFFTTKGTYGSGLGLAVVHGIMVRHGGKVDFISDKENGTVFYLRFPVVTKTEEDSDITGKTAKTEQLNILIVDDDEQIREVLSDMLTIDGYKIRACPDGKTALGAVEEEVFDLMITDLGMPGMSGLELAGIVHENHPNMPIAMITGWGTQLNQDEVALKGISSVLPKPFHLKDIKALIQELVTTQ